MTEFLYIIWGIGQGSFFFLYAYGYKIILAPFIEKIIHSPLNYPGTLVKSNWLTTVHLLEWQKSKTLTIPNAHEDMEQRELSFTACGNAKWYSDLGRHFSVSYKTKCILTVWSSSHAPWYLPKRVESSCPHKNLQTDICCSFIHNCQNLEASKMSFSRWMDELVLPDRRIYSVL